MKKTTADCPQCGKSFTYFPSGYRGKAKIHCSHKCASDTAWLNRECPICGKKFRCRRSDPHDCCSRKCGREFATRDARIVFSCENCGAKVSRAPFQYHLAKMHHFCSHPCWTAWAANQRKIGDDPRPGVIARRRREERTCEECGRVFQRMLSDLRFRGYGRFCSARCRSTWTSKQPDAPQPPILRAAQNGNWKGGYKKYYGPSWKAQRRAARERDNNTCQHCGKTKEDIGRELDVHHIRPFREFGLARHEEANHLDNLVSLCDRCHKAVEPRGCVVR